MVIQRQLSFGTAHWRDLAEVTKPDLEELAAEYGLSPSMMADCLDPDHLPKIERNPGVTFLMLRAYDEKSPEEVVGVQASTRKVAIFWGEHFLLTVHRSPLPWLDQVWLDWEKRKERGPAQIAALVQDIVEECLYTYEAPIDRAGVAVEKLEDTIFHSGNAVATSGEILEIAYLAKKKATLFKRMLRLSRDLLPLLSKLGEPGSPAIQNLKEEADRLYFYSDDLVETANDLVQLSISLNSNSTSKVVRLLTLVSIFLMPLNLLVGVYGMNFAFMPELQWKWGYPMVLALMVVIEVGIYLRLKKRGWVS